MNTGQSILTILAMLLLSILVLRVNNTFLSTGSVLSQSKLGMIAISIANSRLAEIKSKAFDEYTAQGNIPDDNYQTELTQPNHLNKEGSEAYPNFDNIDDYNGFTHDDTIQVQAEMKPEIFHDSCSVVYVTSDNPNQVSSSIPTYNKKVTVFVTHKLLPETIKISSVYSYWNFK